MVIKLKNLQIPKPDSVISLKYKYPSETTIIYLASPSLTRSYDLPFLISLEFSFKGARRATSYKIYLVFQRLGFIPLTSHLMSP